MTFANNPKEVAVGKALEAMAMYMQKAVVDPSISIDDTMLMLQWVYKKIPEVNRLLIVIKTERVNK